MHSEDFKAIKGKQDAHNELLAQLINIGEQHTKTLETVATRDDISPINTVLAEILNRLPPRQ